MKKHWNVIRIILICFFSVVILFSGWQIYRETEKYRQESEVHEEILHFEPVENEPEDEPELVTPYVQPSLAPDVTPVKKKNPSIKEAISQYSKAVGWIKVNHTEINYLFAQTEDNSYYIDHDIKGRKTAAGTIFLDYRCDENLESYNSILYGHHMRNGSMFSGIDKFKKESFFNDNRYGKIYLADATYHIDFFAVCVVKGNDQEIYRVNADTEEQKNAHIAYIKQHARHYRDIEIKPDDRLITLSTCNYEFEDARAVLIGRLVEIIDN